VLYYKSKILFAPNPPKFGANYVIRKTKQKNILKGEKTK